MKVSVFSALVSHRTRVSVAHTLVALMVLLPGRAAAVGTDGVQSALHLSAVYKADAVAVVSGGVDQGLRYLGNLDLVGKLSLEHALGWRGARALAHVLHNNGRAPNSLAGTLQGVDNIEVETRRTKLFQLWLEQDLGRAGAALLIGFYDLNADFYVNEAAGLLIAPAFGIGSELAATGPNGPSIFPSTALAARLYVEPLQGTYAQAAVVNAKAGVLGDSSGPDWGMDEGAVLVGEAGWTGTGKFGIGLWRYTNRQDDILDLDASGQPVRRVAKGAYLLAEHQLAGADDQIRLTGFLRAGISDGNTTPYNGGWQAGLLVEEVLPGRPDSRFSIGAYQGLLSSKYRAVAGSGRRLAEAESGLEITYSDRLNRFVSVQPDLQLVRRPAGDPSIADAVIVGLRVTFEWADE